MGCVYSIAHPLTKQIVYVGKTVRGFEDRMIEHYRRASNLRLRAFMDDLKAKNLMPVCKILQDGIDDYGREICAIERSYIDTYKEMGHPLLNGLNGIPRTHDFKLICEFADESVRQPFEDFPLLSTHIERMANTGQVGSGSEWSAFLREINKVCKLVLEQQSA